MHTVAKRTTEDRRSPSNAPACGDEGFGLIEVVISLTVLALIFAAVGWLIISSLSASQLAKQRSEAAAIIVQQDASLQHLPTLLPAQATLTTAEQYVTTHFNGTVESVTNGTNGSSTPYTVTATGAATPQASTVMTVTLTVSWKPAIGNATVQSISNQVQVPIQ